MIDEDYIDEYDFEDDYDDYECPCTIRGLMRLYIEEYLKELRLKINSFICQQRGHNYGGDIDSVVSSGKESIEITEQRCRRCRKFRIIHTGTREPFTDEESNTIYGLMVLKYMNQESNIFALLPKIPWDKKEG